MKIVYLDHSGFALIGNDCTIIIDYFTDTKNILPSIIANARNLYVLVSHRHPDHFNPEIFKWDTLCENITYILSSDTRRRVEKSRRIVPPRNYQFIIKGEQILLPNITIKAYGSTDIGVSFMLSLENKIIFHAGDFNNWHWSDESTTDEIDLANKKFSRILNTIATEHSYVDVAMFPVVPDMGSDFARGAKEWLSTIKTNIFIPMHFWSKQEEASKVELYQNPNYGKCIILNSGEEIDI